MIEVFEFGGVKVRTEGTHEAPLFCAADVCAVLGYGKPTAAYKRLDQDECTMVKVCVEGAQGRKDTLFVNESGLYTLVLGSQIPQARAFKKWVTSEVLPAIRRKGYYSAIEAAREKQTELLLAQCFPNLPGKAEPIFRGLIAAIEGEQAKRRELNIEPSATSVDYSMLSERAKEAVLQTITTATAVARISTSWEDWKVKMEIAFGKKAIQLPFLVPMASLPGKVAS